LNVNSSSIKVLQQVVYLVLTFRLLHCRNGTAMAFYPLT